MAPEDTTFYPDFVPNQILTSDQLNHLRRYLDRQDRRARVRLVGTGIVCGLDHSVAGECRQIAVGEGFGVSSGGYLIELAETTYTHVRAYQDPDFTEGDDGVKTPLYEPWQAAPSGQLDILELLAARQDGAEPLGPSACQGRVLVLYLEKQPVDLKSCLVTDCNNKGLEIHLIARALLVNAGDLEALDLCDPPPPPVRLPRFHTDTALADLRTADDVNHAWARLIAAHAIPLRNAILRAWEKYGHFLDLDVTRQKQRITVGFNGLKGLADQQLVNQYHYDALTDLAAAYNELAAACKLIVDCCPALDFPRHLMLDALDGTPDFRHEFQPSPLGNVVHGDRQRVRLLFLRVVAMVRAFALEAPEVRLTPSHRQDRPLGDRAVPHYFRLTPGILERWQPRLCCTADPLWSYGDPGEPGALDLDLDYNRATFLRIEGHLDLDCAQAQAEITGERGEHNASFDVLCSHLEDRLQAERELGKTIEAGLAERRQGARDFHAGVMAAARDRSDDADAILDRLRAFTESEASLFEQLRDWTELRRSRPTRCDDGALRTDYLAARAEIFCLFRRFLGELEKRVNVQPLPIEPVTPEELPDGARMMIGDRLAAELISVRKTGDHIDEWLQLRMEEAIGAWTDSDPPDQVEWTLRAAAHALRAAIDRLLYDALPGDLRELSHALFRERYREVTGALLSLRLLWWAWEAQDPGEGDSPHSFLEDFTAVALPVSGSCLGARIAALYFAYDELRGRDLAPFNRLAARVDGLEHLAGVEKCGTFVLVCENGRVVADFSLPCRLPCCCEADLSELCLPPVALPDYRIVELEKEDDETRYQPVDRSFWVLTNDYDPNPAVGEGPARDSLVVVPESFDTVLGGEVQVEESGRVTYRHQGPSPGVLDRFLYTVELTGERCSGSAVGEVLILMAAEPEPEPPPPPDVVICVLDARTGQPIDRAAVSLNGGPPAPTGADGCAYFLDLALGTYEAKASKGGYQTAGIGFEVFPEPALQRHEIRLRPVISGDVTILVVSQSQPIFEARVELWQADTRVMDATTNDAGKAEFEDVETGAYTVVAVRSDYRRTSLSIQVAPGSQEHEIDLKPREGLVRVTLLEAASGAQIREAGVIVAATNGGFEARVTAPNQKGIFVFKGVPVGLHDVTAAGRGLSGASESPIRVEDNDTLEVTVLMFFDVRIKDEFVTWVAKKQGITQGEARARAGNVYGRRRGAAVASLATAAEDPAVARTAGYRSAFQLIDVAVNDPALGDEEIIAAYQETAKALARSIAAVQPQRKEPLREVLLAVSLAFLDRLTLANPQTAGRAVLDAVGQTAGAVEAAGVDPERLRTGWQGERLTEELGVASVSLFRARLG